MCSENERERQSEGWAGQTDGRTDRQIWNRTDALLPLPGFSWLCLRRTNEGNVWMLLLCVGIWLTLKGNLGIAWFQERLKVKQQKSVWVNAWLSLFIFVWTTPMTTPVSIEHTLSLHDKHSLTQTNTHLWAAVEMRNSDVTLWFYSRFKIGSVLFCYIFIVCLLKFSLSNSI